MTRDYAESILEVGTKPLRRRDRAALKLALECLRGRTVLDRESDGEEWPEYYSDMRVSDAMIALKCASPWRVAGEVHDALRHARKRSARRLLRARLALLLRVLLRVNVGDYGWPQVPVDPWGYRASVPLYALAPAHHTGRTPRERREGRG